MVMPPQSTVTPSNTAPAAHVVDVDDALELLELDLLEDELLELLWLDDEELLLLEEELEDLLDELLDFELLLEEALLLGTEHSLTPPDTRVPVPKVASLQTKLPLSVLYVNEPDRPKATLVLLETEQV